jgi:hypothetical protein
MLQDRDTLDHPLRPAPRRMHGTARAQGIAPWPPYADLLLAAAWSEASNALGPIRERYRHHVVVKVVVRCVVPSALDDAIRCSSPNIKREGRRDDDILPDLDAGSEKLDDAGCKDGPKRLKGALIEKMRVFQAPVPLDRMTFQRG